MDFLFKSKRAFVLHSCIIYTRTLFLEIYQKKKPRNLKKKQSVKLLELAGVLQIPRPSLPLPNCCKLPKLIGRRASCRPYVSYPPDFY